MYRQGLFPSHAELPLREPYLQLGCSQPADPRRQLESPARTPAIVRQHFEKYVPHGVPSHCDRPNFMASGNRFKERCEQATPCPTSDPLSLCSTSSPPATVHRSCFGTTVAQAASVSGVAIPNDPCDGSFTSMMSAPPSTAVATSSAQRTLTSNNVLLIRNSPPPRHWKRTDQQLVVALQLRDAR